MMAIETTAWDITQVLDSDEAIAAYLDAVFEDGDLAEIRRAIGHVARAKGMTQLARDTGITREALYKALGEHGNPTLDTLSKILGALGLRLSVTV
jgi:probable addiction module antidote protein